MKTPSSKIGKWFIVSSASFLHKKQFDFLGLCLNDHQLIVLKMTME